MLILCLTFPHILSWYYRDYDWMCWLWNYSVKLLTSLWFEPLYHVVRNNALVVDLELSATTFQLLSIFPTTSLFLFHPKPTASRVPFRHIWPGRWCTHTGWERCFMSSHGQTFNMTKHNFGKLSEHIGYLLTKKQIAKMQTPDCRWGQHTGLSR